MNNDAGADPGRCKRLWASAMPAVLIALLLMAAPAGAAGPSLQLTRFDSDRTISPGRTSSVAAFCRRGFTLMATSFAPIAVNPSGAGNVPAFTLLDLVPEPKGARFRIRNVGTTTVTVRASAHCVRIGGGASLRTRVITVKPRGNRRAAANNETTLAAVCDTPNSIPGDIGFENRGGSEFAGASFFKRDGDIGVRARFRGRPEAFHFTCVQGKGVRMNGRLRGGGRRAGDAASRRERSGKPSIGVRYERISASPLTLGFPGVSGFVADATGPPWTNPLPEEIGAGEGWLGRGFLARLPLRFPRASSEEESTYTMFTEEEIEELRAVWWSYVGSRGFDHKDRRSPDPFEEVDPFTDGGGNGPAPQCNNAVDDDGDGNIDFPADAGCLTPDDTTELETGWRVDLPPDGGSTVNWLTLKPRGAAVPVGSVAGYRIMFNPVLHESATLQHGSEPITGSTPCGAGTTMEISAGVGSQAPTTSPTLGTPIPEPVPDEDHMRIIVDTTNAVGCPASVDMRVAVDTR